jgi:spore germination protein YaaH
LEAIGYSLEWNDRTVQISTSHSLTWVHGFYAFASFGQRELIRGMDSVSFGWSVMEWDEENGVQLNTTSLRGNEWRIPEGYELIADYPRANGARTHLNIFMDTFGGLNGLIACENSRSAAVTEIISELTRVYEGIGRNPFDGVTINFEGLRGEKAKSDFTNFLTELSVDLRANGLTLYVTVHPATTDGIYFDGYDYRAIGQLADRVILMTHDYHPRSMEGFIGTEWQIHAALTPIAEIRRALEAITDPQTGVEDKNKIAIAFSFQNIGWFVDENNRIVSPNPISVSMETVLARMAQPDTFFGWSETYRNPYIIYSTENGERVFLWYENNQSVREKIELAKKFGVTGASVWRTGIIPNETEWDVWENFLK